MFRLNYLNPTGLLVFNTNLIDEQIVCSSTYDFCMDIDTLLDESLSIVTTYNNEIEDSKEIIDFDLAHPNVDSWIPLVVLLRRFCISSYTARTFTSAYMILMMLRAEFIDQSIWWSLILVDGTILIDH